MSKYQFIIVAGGSGSRFGSSLPKQFMPLAGKPVVMRTIEACRKALPEAEFFLVLPKEHIPLWKELCENHLFESPEIVEGGKSRFHSVLNAITLYDEDTKITLIHDGVRPFVTKDMIDRILAPFKYSGTKGVIPVVPVTDSIRTYREGDSLSHSIPRDMFKLVQTPQAFRTKYIVPCYDVANYELADPQKLTDDASVFEFGGYNVKLSEGDPYNMKITNPLDLAIAEAIFNARETKGK